MEWLLDRVQLQHPAHGHNKKVHDHETAKPISWSRYGRCCLRNFL